MISYYYYLKKIIIFGFLQKIAISTKTISNYNDFSKIKALFLSPPPLFFFNFLNSYFLYFFLIFF